MLRYLYGGLLIFFITTQGLVSAISSDLLEKRRCTIYDRGTYLSVSLACIGQDGDLPRLSFTDTIDALLPYVEDVSAIYETDADAFWYTTAELMFTPDIESFRNWSVEAYIAEQGEITKHLIDIPKIALALQQVDEYTFFAATRNTRTYGPCRLQNYLVAMDVLDTYLLQPGEQLNMNTLIAHHPDYCTGTAGRFMFYQGVCGGSTQLFWNALVNPYLYVVERHPHGEFWQNFYGHMGEDAGIYERSKELILENIGNERIYFRTFVGPDGNTVLLSAYPKKEGLRSYIQKQQTGTLRADLINKITDEHGALKYEQSWESRYWGVNDTKDL